MAAAEASERELSQACHARDWLDAPGVGSSEFHRVRFPWRLPSRRCPYWAVTHRGGIGRVAPGGRRHMAARSHRTPDTTVVLVRHARCSNGKPARRRHLLPCSSDFVRSAPGRRRRDRPRPSARACRRPDRKHRRQPLATPHGRSCSRCRRTRHRGNLSCHCRGTTAAAIPAAPRGVGGVGGIRHQPRAPHSGRRVLGLLRPDTRPRQVDSRHPDLAPDGRRRGGRLLRRSNRHAPSIGQARIGARVSPLAGRGHADCGRRTPCPQFGRRGLRPAGVTGTRATADLRTSPSLATVRQLRMLPCGHGGPIVIVRTTGNRLRRRALAEITPGAAAKQPATRARCVLDVQDELTQETNS